MQIIYLTLNDSITYSIVYPTIYSINYIILSIYIYLFFYLYIYYIYYIYYIFISLYLYIYTLYKTSYNMSYKTSFKIFCIIIEQKKRGNFAITSQIFINLFSLVFLFFSFLLYIQHLYQYNNLQILLLVRINHIDIFYSLISHQISLTFLLSFYTLYLQV